MRNRTRDRIFFHNNAIQHLFIMDYEFSLDKFTCRVNMISDFNYLI